MLPINATADDYISGVLDGTVISGSLIRKACIRHIEDLKSGESRGLYFDAEAPLRVIEFIETFCTPPNQTDPMKLMPWEKMLIHILYGWKRIGDGSRRFRRVHTEVGKKNGKTALGAALCLYHLIADGELSARCFCSATTGKQAKICFLEACAMRDRHPDLKELIGKTGAEPPTALYVAGTGSRLSCMSRDSAAEDGALVSFAILDEIHRYANRELWSVLRFGGRTRKQPLLFGITTAGASAGGTSICWAEREYATKVLDGHTEDDELAAFIFSMDDADDYRDERNWAKANPSMGLVAEGYLFDVDTIRKEFLETEGKPSSRGEFLRFCLNRWSSESENPAIEIGKWDACCRELIASHPSPKTLRSQTIEALKRRVCFGAVDLAPKLDTSALTLLFPPLKAGEKWRVIEYFWCPKDNIADRVKRDRVPYDRWAEDGFITPTEGNLTDVRFIADQITEINKLFDLREVAYDSSWSSELIRMLSESGFPMDKFVDFPQTHGKMNGPCHEFVRKILRKEFAHDHNPVMRWQVSNLRWNTQKTTNFIRPDRTRKREKIDGPASLIMALARATDPDNIVKPKKQFTIFTSQ